MTYRFALIVAIVSLGFAGLGCGGRPQPQVGSPCHEQEACGSAGLYCSQPRQCANDASCDPGSRCKNSYCTGRCAAREAARLLPAEPPPPIETPTEPEPPVTQAEPARCLSHDDCRAQPNGRDYCSNTRHGGMAVAEARPTTPMTCRIAADCGVPATRCVRKVCEGYCEHARP